MVLSQYSSQLYHGIYQICVMSSSGQRVSEAIEKEERLFYLYKAGQYIIYIYYMSGIDRRSYPYAQRNFVIWAIFM